MLVALAVIASAVCLALGLTTGPFLLVWIALDISLVGLVLIGVSMLLRRRTPRAADGASRPGVAKADPGADAAVANDPVLDRAADDAGDGVGSDAERADLQCTDPEPALSRYADSEAVLASDAKPAGPGRTACGDKPAPAPSDASASEATVLVVPGRRRFHREDCRLLANKPSEEIAVDEALEEGFTPCTTCIPDRAVFSAAR